MAVRVTDWLENDLYFDFSNAQSAVKLDSNDHGMTHKGLKPIDFVVEWPDQFWLVEVKDPENSNIPPQHQLRQKMDFAKKLQSGSLLKYELFPKFRDSLIYLGMDVGIPRKPLSYLTLIGLSSLDSAHLTYLSELLYQTEWLQGPKRGWRKHFSARVFNLDLWNRVFPHCPITRIGSENSR